MSIHKKLKPIVFLISLVLVLIMAVPPKNKAQDSFSGSQQVTNRSAAELFPFHKFIRMLGSRPAPERYKQKSIKSFLQ